MNVRLLVFAITLVGLSACNPLKKLINQINSDLPTELKNRFYHRDFVGSYIKNPEDILGRLIYMYRINDSTFVYKTSITRYPNNLGTIKHSEDPVLRASGTIEIKNSNEFGLFLSAFNLNALTNSNDAAEIVVIDNREVSINGDTIQNYFVTNPILPIQIYRIDTNTYQPEIIFYVRGVDITTVSAKSAKSFSNATDASGAFFKMNNKYYAAGTSFTFDYKAGMTVDDVTSYVKSGSTNRETPQKNESENLNVLDSLMKNTPFDKAKSLLFKRGI